jgi:hypothetical protein
MTYDSPKQFKFSRKDTKFTSRPQRFFYRGVRGVSVAPLRELFFFLPKPQQLRSGHKKKPFTPDDRANGLTAKLKNFLWKILTGRFPSPVLSGSGSKGWIASSQRESHPQQTNINLFDS